MFSPYHSGPPIYSDATGDLDSVWKLRERVGDKLLLYSGELDLRNDVLDAG